MNWYLKALKDYADFNGRARRTEYWMYTLFNLLIVIGIAIVGSIFSSTSDTLGSIVGIVYVLYALGTVIPSLAVAVRRMHDINKSGWMLLVAFIPLIGSIWLIILLATEGTTGSNSYGEDPKETLNLIA